LRLLTTLDRYILREYLVPFFASTVIFVLLLQFNFAIFLFKTLNVNAIPSIALVQLILYKTPDLIRLTLVVGIALASSLAISRMARESEFVAMWSSGVSVLRTLRPVGLVGILVSVANFFVMNNLLPPAEREFQRLWNELLLIGIAPDFRSNVVVNLQNYNISIKDVSREKDGSMSLNHLNIFENPNEKEHWFYETEKGKYSQGVWTLEKPTIYRVKDDQLVLARSNGQLVINERITVPDMYLLPETHASSLSDLEVARKNHLKEKASTRQIDIAFHNLFSIPAACMVFSIISPYYSIRYTRWGAFTGILLSLFAVFAYYYVFLICLEILGAHTNLNPILVSWLPNILFLLLSLAGIRRTLRQ
jgi:lipopolysaccharide export system permease protein